MNLRSLIPFQQQRGSVARPDVMLFGPLHREIDRLFDDFARGIGPLGGTALMPSMDVVETDKEIEITAELPGLEQNDVEISLVDDVLTIRGEKKAETEKKDKNYHVTERSYGVFYRALQLPPGIDPGNIRATMSNGVLKITIPKPARSEAQKIEVRNEAAGQGESQGGGQPKGEEQGAGPGAQAA
jgi:HSP20 family protein